MIRFVLRGGSYYSDGTCTLRSTFRFWSLPVYRFRFFGLRLVVKRAVAVDV